jgi:hypothetical protein
MGNGFPGFFKQIRGYHRVVNGGYAAAGKSDDGRQVVGNPLRNSDNRRRLRIELPNGARNTPDLFLRRMRNLN